MVVPTVFPNINIKSIRSAVNGLSDQALVIVLAHYAVGILGQHDPTWQPPLPAPSMSPIRDIKNESTIRFGSVPDPPSDTLGNGGLGTTGEKETTLGTPDSVVQTGKTRAEASDAKKLKKMWRGRRLADKAVYNEIKELSAALGREPCTGGTNHFELVNILAGLKKEMARTPSPPGEGTVSKDTTNPPRKKQTKPLREGSRIRAPSRRNQGKGPENEGLPDKHSRAKRSPGAIAAKNPAEKDTSSPREQADNQSVGLNNMITLNLDGPTSKSLPVIEITGADNGVKIEQIPDLRNAAVEEEAAEKRVAQEANENIDKPASVNETVEKTTGNDPTHNGNRTASDNNRHSHNNDPVIPHAPGAPLTFRDQNIDNLLAEKPASMNIDEPATVNETVEKTTGNDPTHYGNKTASDNNRHSHNNQPVLQHAPGATSTFFFENPKPEQQANDRIREQAGTTLVGDINQHGISGDLEKIALSPEDLNRGRIHHDKKMWEASVDALSVERILSAESYACLFRQLAYYFTLDHIGSNTHASELHCRDDGFTIRDLMSWNRMQGITLEELTEFIREVPGLYYRSSEEDDYMNVNWDEVYESHDGLSDDLNEMSDDDKKKYLLKNADQYELNEIYWENPITVWNEEKLLDFIVFSRQLVNSGGYDSDGAFGIGFASL